MASTAPNAPATFKFREGQFETDEKVEEFIQLRDLIVQTVQDPIILAKVAPVLIEIAPNDIEQKEKLLQALQPPPPDPMQQQIQMEQIQSQIRLTNANAAALEATAARERAGAQEDISQANLENRKAAVEIDKGIAQIDKDIAQTTKIEADTAAVIANIGMQAYQAVNQNNNTEQQA